MKCIVTWAVFGGLIVALFDLLLAGLALLGLIHGGFYQVANLPAIVLFHSGPDSVEHSLPIWVPQMGLLGFAVGQC